MPTPLDSLDLVEVYAAASAVEADRLVLLLTDDDIEAIARETTMSSFPSQGSHLILVKEPDRERARKLIEAARLEGAVSEKGAFL